MELELKHKDILPYLDKGIKFHLPIESDRFDSIIEHEPFRLALPFMEQEEQDKYLEKYKGMYLFQKEPFIANEDGRIFLGEMQCSLGFEEDDVFLDEVLPIMRPLSFLTKEITHNGETLIPIVELARIAGIYTSKYKLSKTDICFGVRFDIENDDNDDKYEVFAFDTANGFGHHFRPSNTWTIVRNQFELWEQLIEWKFWIGDQSYFEKRLIKAATNEYN